ncbi:MAG: hypothetical protein ABL999_13875 [Pyrinomonadaceae bacterium]
MAKNSVLISIILPALIGAVFATAACVFFFYFYAKKAATVDANAMQTPAASPMRTPQAEIPNPEIKASDVNSISIETVYPGYFPAGNKCAQTYNEYFGNQDGIGSSSSPCTAKITFDRNGRATRTVVVSRWDKTTKGKREVERTETTARVLPEQFAQLAQEIVSNQAFKDWREGTMINVSNCTITVAYNGGTRSPMSNVSDKTIAYNPMVDAIKRLEAELRWK